MSYLPHSYRFLFLSILVASGLGAPSARAQVVGGTISGDVVDPSGGAVSGAKILIFNQETGTVRELITSEGGTFSAPSVPVGAYSVTVSRDGFAPQQRTGISLAVGQGIHLHLTLSVGGSHETVSVVDTPQVVDLSTQQSQGLVDEHQVKELPLNGRSYDQLIELNPAAVSYTTERSGGVGTSNSSVGNMFSVSGRRPQDNLFLLNGVEYTGSVADQRDARGHERPAARRGCGARVQCCQRYLRRELRQADRRSGLHRHCLRRQRSAWFRL